MANIFDSVLIQKPRRSMLNLSHDVKLTLDMGYLVPVLCREVLPGDRWKVNVNAFVKMLPLMAPVMQRFDLKLEAWNVPNRLVFTQWPEFITGGEDGEAEIAAPKISLNGVNCITNKRFTNGSLADYLGYPTIDPQADINDFFSENDSLVIDRLAFSGYQLIYNENYRDPNLTDEVDILSDFDGVFYDFEAPDKALAITQLRKRCWRKDYFTSALPFVQRGSDVLLPVGNQFSSVGFKDDEFGTYIRAVGESNLPLNPTSNVGGLLYSKFDNQSAVLTGSSMTSDPNQGGTKRPIQLDNSRSLYVDTRNTTASINDLRLAYAVQRWKERNAVGGARYKEQLLAHFGRTVNDARLQRPEFLGASTSPIIIGEISQTSQTTEDSVLGGFAGNAAGVNNGYLFDRTFDEHGYVFVLMSVIPRASYSQGMPRQFTRNDRYDYAWPVYAHLGEQPVYVQEIMFNFPAKPYTRENDEVFGYQSRYAEYKFIAPSIHGAMKDSLDYWHAGRIFSDSPYLNSSFVTCNATNRIFAVDNLDIEDVPTSYQHHLLSQVVFDIRAIRPLPKYELR